MHNEWQWWSTVIVTTPMFIVGNQTKLFALWYGMVWPLHSLLLHSSVILPSPMLQTKKSKFSIITNKNWLTCQPCFRSVECFLSNTLFVAIYWYLDVWTISTVPYIGHNTWKVNESTSSHFNLLWVYWWVIFSFVTGKQPCKVSILTNSHLKDITSIPLAPLANSIFFPTNFSFDMLGNSINNGNAFHQAIVPQVDIYR